jgi:hypothetical protein
MRIVFVNLHTNEFLVKTASKYIFKQSVAIKHRYLLDYLLNETDIEVCSYVNRNGTSIAHSLPQPLMGILRACRFLESKWVLKKNGVAGKIKILKKMSDIRHDDMIIIYQLFAESCPELADVKSFKVVSMLHFFGTQSNSDAIRKLKPDLLIAESNLKKYSAIFQKYYSWYKKDILVHPFVFEKRFLPKRPFGERKNCVFSTGTITYKKHPEFIDVYGDPCDQPIRKYVKDHREELKGMIDCFNSDYSEDANKKMEVKANDNRLTRLVKGFYYKFFASQQKSYYSFNMVDKFNDYKMCLIGEEILGVPGIGFVEGMACGCAYIGHHIGYYEDYGMKEGTHYIGYDGTPDDLKEKISYYQQPGHQNELECIAKEGCDFVRTKFNAKQAAKDLLVNLQEAQIQNQ